MKRNPTLAELVPRHHEGPEAALLERMGRSAGNLWRKLLKVGQRRPHSLRLCESLSLGDRRFIAVVEYGSSRFLLGGTSGSLVLLAKLNSGPEGVDGTESCAAPEARAEQ